VDVNPRLLQTQAILISNGLCELFLVYLKQPYVCLKVNIVVATTYHKGQMISLTSKSQSRSMMWVFTRELNKESLLN